MLFSSSNTQPSAKRRYSFFDKLIHEGDQALRVLNSVSVSSTARRPAPDIQNNTDLTESEKRHAAGLMRVNHSGEVCAQALYQGQRLTAKSPKIREKMRSSAEEEVEHLDWCEKRLEELNSRPSALNPLWYTSSFALGALTGAVSDRLSLGFVAATEDQVCEHLNNHLNKLPENDLRSKAIVTQMHQDETEHAEAARHAGGIEFPGPVKTLMSVVALAMTKTSYRV